MTTIPAGSAIYWGHVGHLRTGPQRHEFSYPLVLVALNLGFMGALPWPLRFNRRGIFSVWERDYLPGPGTTLLERARARFQLSLDQEIILLTMPRFLGYVFNPVNFYLIRTPGGSLDRLVAEVHNTFGEAHVYECPAAPENSANLVAHRFAKDFYVSPFLECSGLYEMVVQRYDEKLELQVALNQSDTEVFRAWMSANRRSLTTTGLVHSIFRFGVGILLVMVRIHWQALVITLRKGGSVFLWNRRNAPATISSNQTWIHRLRLRILLVLKIVTMKRAQQRSNTP